MKATGTNSRPPNGCCSPRSKTGIFRPILTRKGLFHITVWGRPFRFGIGQECRGCHIYPVLRRTGFGFAIVTTPANTSLKPGEKLTAVQDKLNPVDETRQGGAVKRGEGRCEERADDPGRVGSANGQHFTQGQVPMDYCSAMRTWRDCGGEFQPCEIM
jgi:hypothetical protein